MNIRSLPPFPKPKKESAEPRPHMLPCLAAVLGASPPVQQAIKPYEFATVAVPSWTIGYCTPGTCGSNPRLAEQHS
jgi:hypothetical protein